MGLPFEPAAWRIAGLPGFLWAWLLLIAAAAVFTRTLILRLQPLRAAQVDPRQDALGRRLAGVLSFGILQRRQPRYFWAGMLHLVIFWGFVVLGLRSVYLLTRGLNVPVLQPLMETGFGAFYATLKDVFELLVLIACLAGIFRRAVLRPARYQGCHTAEAYLVLGLIAFLMISDMAYEGNLLRMGPPAGAPLPAARLAALVMPDRLSPGPAAAWSYWLHVLAFFFFLNLLPLGKHFHIITALPNVFFRKTRKGSLKPARWGVEDLEELDTLGVGRLEEMTWKHLLDLYTCTECGRCSDQCPAYAVGRPLSPKRMTMALRDHLYGRRPVLPGRRAAADEDALVGGVIEPEAIWSCTTCGACEEECPIFIEYIDKIVDFRRHLIETGRNPKTFNPVLMHLEKTGNPFGKPPSKRTDWVRDLNGVPVRVLGQGDAAEVLLFVDSYGSFDPVALQGVAALARVLHRAGVDFGILGPREKDCGHQVRRIGEEGLFQLLVEENLEAFGQIDFKCIVTADPHAFNTLRHDYPGDLEVVHYAAYVAELMAQGRLKISGKAAPACSCTYHDPCYLGRHNGVYGPPRLILDTIPGLRRVEMARCRDRSFCCGGGDVALWHEIVQQRVRMAEMRVQMARETGAEILVTACPFCRLHFEDAVKTQGLEGTLAVVDLMELLEGAL